MADNAYACAPAWSFHRRPEPCLQVEVPVDLPLPEEEVVAVEVEAVEDVAMVRGEGVVGDPRAEAPLFQLP